MGCKFGGGGRLTVQGFKITTSGIGSALRANASSVLEFGNIEFGGAAWHHIEAANQSLIACEGIGDYTIAGNAGLAHILAENASTVSIAGRTVTLTDTPSLNITAHARNVSSIRAHAVAFSGSATGQRYNVSANAVINTGGGGGQLLPWGHGWLRNNRRAVSMTGEYDTKNWYWIVEGDESKVFASSAKAYVDAKDEAYRAWLDKGNLPTRIKSEAELWDVLADHAPECLPGTAEAQDIRREKQLSRLDEATLRVLLNHENRLRALEGRQAVTATQLKSAAKALL
jgi:hypothetical protein